MHSFPFQMQRLQRIDLRSSVIQIIPYVAVALLFQLSTLMMPVNIERSAEIVSVTMSDSAEGIWYPADLQTLVLDDESAWLKVVFSLPAASVKNGAVPLGLYLSGTFSARAIWNGVSIGSKGSPGPTRRSEKPGPVDTVIHLPEQLLRPGNNTLMLEMSSHYRQPVLVTIIHGAENIAGLRIAPFSAEKRRPIAYYGIPFLVLMFLLTSFIALLVRPSLSSGAHLLSLIIVCSLFLAAAAEIFRSFYAYPYNYHSLRIWLIASAILVFGGSLFFYCLKQCGLNLSVRWLVSLGVAVLLTLVLSEKTLNVLALDLFKISSIFCIFMILWSHKSEKPASLSLAAAVFCLLVFSVLDTEMFFDRTLYASSIPLLVFLVRQSGAWEAGMKEAQLPQSDTVSESARPPIKLIIKSAGKQKIVLIADILAIHGAGNYAEIEMLNGEKLLDDRGLRELEKVLSADFTRVHRSHIVNLNFIVAIHSSGAGKHVLEMANKVSYPVSRTLIKQLREKLSHVVQKDIA